MEKRYDQKQAEAQAQQLWQEQQTYQINKSESDSQPLFSIDTPPPTVSGSLHIGHVFSYTQTDILARYKRMQGYRVFYPFGFDDNGLPTERYVEKKLNVRAHTLERSDFIKLCLQETAESAKIFTQLWQRLGISADWSNTYSTISPTTRRIAQQSFLALLEKQYVYRRFEPAIYCSACRTSVAQADLDDSESASTFNDIVFLDEQGNQLIVGTTRPELLFSCVALLYHPSDTRYQHLDNTLATTPLFGQKVRIFSDELVNPEKGTGLVMVCTFGDKTDIEWYKKYQLPYIQSIGFDGKFVTSVPHFVGLSVIEARKKCLELLAQESLLVHQKPIMHSVSVHERCKKPVEYLVLAQWFVNILDHKKKFIALADEIAWYPQFMKTRYINWVENLNWDWGISRQRLFGIPFPVWHCIDCQTMLTAQPDQLPVDPQERTYGKPCHNCGGTNIVADKDVMDTWNTSSLSPYICTQLYNGSAENPFAKNSHQEFLPMALRPQAHDIIRTWAFYTIVKSYLHHGTIPWKEIVISGHVQSAQKEKISKSQGNSVLAPDQLLEQHSADAIRYWTAATTLGQDTAFSVEQLKLGQRLVTKLWNAFLFAQPHIEGVLTQDIPTKLGAANEWLLHALTLTEQAYHHYLDTTHEFGHALQKLEQFFWNTYCDNYIELVKNQLFNPHEYDAQTVYATRWTLYTVGLRLLKLFAPYVPHVTEMIYQALYAQQIQAPSLHQTRFEIHQDNAAFAYSYEQITQVVELLGRVRKLKTEKQLSLKVPIAQLCIYNSSSALRDALAHNEQLFKGVSQVEKLVHVAEKPIESGLISQGETLIAYVIYE